MKEAGLAVELLETRHVRDAFKAMPVKTDRNDARGIAQLMRLGWFRPVHCKSLARAGDARAADGAQAAAVEAPRRGDEPARGAARLRAEGRADDAERGSPGGSASWSTAIATLKVVAEALLAAHEVLLREFGGFEKQPAQDGAGRRAGAAADDEHRASARSWRSPTPSAMDDPGRFRSSKAVGAHFGLTPKKYQSGETDVTGRITKIGDGWVRTALYEAANVILTRPVKGSALKSWAARLAKRAGMKQGEGGARPEARRGPAPHAGSTARVRFDAARCRQAA